MKIIFPAFRFCSHPESQSWVSLYWSCSLLLLTSAKFQLSALQQPRCSRFTKISRECGNNNNYRDSPYINTSRLRSRSCRPSFDDKTLWGKKRVDCGWDGGQGGRLLDGNTIGWRVSRQHVYQTARWWRRWAERGRAWGGEGSRPLAADNGRICRRIQPLALGGRGTTGRVSQNMLANCHTHTLTRTRANTHGHTLQ